MLEEADALSKTGTTTRAVAMFLRSSGVGFIVGLAGVLLLFRSLIGQSLSTTLWGNDLDPHLIVWTLEWVYHTVFERWAPFDVWNANSYFPYARSLAFADSLFAAQLIYAPLRLIGVEALPALYFTLAGTCIIGAMLTDRLLQGYDFKAGERALIVAAAHFSLPMTTFLFSHYQLFGMQLLPPLLLALHRLVNEWRGKDLVLVTVLFCLAGGFATYIVPMFGLVAALVLLVFSARLLWGKSPVAIVRSLGWQSLLVSLVLLLLFFFVQLRPHLSLFKYLPPQPMSETFVYSGRPWSVLFHSSLYSYWYPPRRVDTGYWERAAFPGVPLLVLAAVGGLAFLWRLRKLDQSGKPIVSLTAYAVAVLAISWMLSWGPYVMPWVGHDVKVDLPFALFAQLIPGVANIRAPGRFAQFYGLPLGLMAVMGVRWIVPRMHLARSAIAGLLAAVVLVDQMPVASTYPFAIRHAEFYRAARPFIEEGKPIVELPIFGAEPLSTWRNRLLQLESSTVHWAKLVAGAGSRDTPELSELLRLDEELRAGTGSINEIAAFARRLGIRKLVVFPGDYPAEVRARIVGQIEGLGGKILLKNSEGLILELPEG